MKTTDLTQGSIFKSLWIMAVPLISASFIQMAYSMTDMLWLGHLGSDAVAAAGAAGFFTAMSAYNGHNYCSGNYVSVRKCLRKTLDIPGSIG